MDGHNANFVGSASLNSYVPSEATATTADVFHVLWRWKLLPIAGMIFGLAGGYLKFRSEPPTFVSSALLQVSYPQAGPAPGDRMDDRMDSGERIRGNSRFDETMIIKSDRVIRLAAKEILANPPASMAGKNEDEIISFILADRRLTVEPGTGRDGGTALISMSFVCPSAEASQQILQSLIDGYESYLGAAYRNWGHDLIEVVSKAQEAMQQNYEKLSQKQIEFRRTAPGTWTGEEMRDPHAENCLAIKSEITAIQIEKQKLVGTKLHVANAQAATRPAEAILMMLSNNRDSTKPPIGEPDRSLPLLGTEQKREDLSRMQMREAELLDTLGESHPSVSALRRRIALMETHLQKTTQQDRENVEKSKTPAENAFTPEKQLALWCDALTEQIQSLEQQEAGLKTLADQAEAQSKELQSFIAQNRVLNSEMHSIETLLEGYSGTLNRLRTMPQGTQTSMQVLTPPLPGNFFGPKLAPYLIGGGSAGLVLLAGLALLLDWSEKTFRDPDEISDQLGIQILGHIPHIAKTRSKARLAVDTSIATILQPRGAASEAYRSVRTGLYFRENADRIRVIQITSPVPGDGKSTLAANLAVACAQSGRRVLLIDADFRRPRIAALFRIGTKLGMSDVLLGKIPWREVIFQSPLDCLAILPCGQPPANPAELLSSPKFAGLIATLRESFDYIIIDSPPLLAVSDPCAIAAVADGVILNIRLRRNAKPLAISAVQLLQTVKANVLGVVVNGIGSPRRYGYYANKYSSYYHNTPVSNAVVSDHKMLNIDSVSTIASPNRDRSEEKEVRQSARVRT